MSEQIALRLVAPLGAEAVELLLRLHPFGGHLKPQAAGEREDRAHDGFLLMVPPEPLHETPVNLDLVERKAP